ncbi:UDP-glucose 4-epimerase GalE [SAR116 cluster bacterium]|nr:UDP-glucose 4-epimerase GalE [SAR116 cluster bacterium]
MRILVTGGAGYIGSHTLIELLARGHELFVIDNYANSSPEVLSVVQEITGKSFRSDKVDITDEPAMGEVFSAFGPEAVIHFAGLKAVGESEELPLHYYEVNVGGSVALLKCMSAHGCNSIIFSSSATVYGEPQYLPYDEAHPLAPVNVYGRTKYFIEEIIRDWARAGEGRKGILLRYFNPVGAHPSGKIGENPRGIPNNLMPFISQVATGVREQLKVFGGDYDTVDGTGVRDYLHVCDLADGHVAALDYLRNCDGVEAFNLGTGNGVSVLELVSAFEEASGQKIPYQIVDRRAGDVATSFADASRALELMNWSTKRGVPEMCEDAWNWVSPKN